MRAPPPHEPPQSAPVLTALAVLAALALAAFPLIGSDFYIQMVSQMMIMAIFAMSLDLLLGVTGLVSLGHAGFFGLAGYALALMTPQSHAVSLWWSLPAVLAITAAAALVIGFFVIRTRGIYFIMVTLAFSQMLYYLFHDNKFAGGSDGIYVYFRPDSSLFGWMPFDLEDRHTFFYVTLIATALVFLFLRRLLTSTFGRALVGIRVNEHRMHAVGYPVFRYKLAVFTLGGTLAGLAGYLWAAQTGFINPELLGFHLSAQAIMMVILGGKGQIAGAVLGAFAFEALMHLFKDLTKHWQLLMGGFIVLLVLFARDGLLGLLAGLSARWSDRKGVAS